MKALSLTQPWATAVALGVKRWETRSWPTSYRGEVCIHASKKFPGWAKDFAEEAGMNVATLPLGRIVCVCDLTQCRQTATLAPTLPEVETKWGDYSPGRYAFSLDNVRALPDPIFARGALGFWAVGWDEAVAVIRALKQLPEAV